MLRTPAVLGLILGLAGCGQTPGAREVPVSKSQPDSPPTAPDAATKAPRAIATH